MEGGFDVLEGEEYGRFFVGGVFAAGQVVEQCRVCGDEFGFGHAGDSGRRWDADHALFSLRSRP